VNIKEQGFEVGHSFFADIRFCFKANVTSIDYGIRFVYRYIIRTICIGYGTMYRCVKFAPPARRRMKKIIFISFLSPNEKKQYR
jgi:hypothetical protein